MSVSSSFGINCPENSKFYTGNTTATFLGCCTIDPATTSDGLCPNDSLRAATFNPAAYSSIPKQQCAGADGSALWYVCAYTKPPFMGCCAVNACDQGGCAQAHLRPAKLSSDVEDANVFIGSSASISTTSSSSSTASSTSTASSSPTTATTARPSSTPLPPKSGNQGMQPAAVAGLAIGTAAGVSIIAMLIFWLVRKRRAAASARHDYALLGGAGPASECQTPAAASAWAFDNGAAAYSKHLSLASLHQGGGRQSVPPEYSAAVKQSPAPARLPGSATTAVFELHEETSPPMQSFGFSHR